MFKDKHETIKRKQSVIHFLLKGVFNVNDKNNIIYSKHMNARITNKFGYQSVENFMIKLAEKGLQPASLKLSLKIKEKQNVFVNRFCQIISGLEIFLVIYNAVFKAPFVG